MWKACPVDHFDLGKRKKDPRLILTFHIVLQCILANTFPILQYYQIWDERWLVPVRHPCMSMEPFWRVPRGCWSVDSSSSISSTSCAGNSIGPLLVGVSPRHLFIWIRYTLNSSCNKWFTFIPYILQTEHIQIGNIGYSPPIISFCDICYYCSLAERQFVTSTSIVVIHSSHPQLKYIPVAKLSQSTACPKHLMNSAMHAFRFRHII